MRLSKRRSILPEKAGTQSRQPLNILFKFRQLIFPVNSNNLANEWSRAGFDIRHRFVMGGNLSAPLGVRLNPFVIFNSLYDAV